MEDFIIARRRALAAAQDFMAAAEPGCDSVQVGGLRLDRSGNVRYMPQPEPGSVPVPVFVEGEAA